jgi:hypothetical protein
MALTIANGLANIKIAGLQTNPPPGAYKDATTGFRQSAGGKSHFKQIESLNSSIQIMRY